MDCFTNPTSNLLTLFKRPNVTRNKPIGSKCVNVNFRYGIQVATHPWWAILGCFVIAGLSAIGLLEYRTENNAFKLWIPDNSEFLENYNFLQEKFPPDTRFNNFLVASDNNVLTPDIIKLVRNFFSSFIKLKSLYNNVFQTFCFRVT